MTQRENELLGSAAVDRLVTQVEEATRATKDAPRRFIEPARGTLDRAKSRRHHIVFGRRGSGKTSLLRKAGADLTLHRAPIASDGRDRRVPAREAQGRRQWLD